MNPFADANIVKECTIKVANTLFDDKKDIIETIRSSPLSASSNTRNTEILSKENHSHLIHVLSATGYACYASAMDESCDYTDTAQLCIFLRYLDNTSEQFVEEILTILSLLGTTYGEVNFIRAKLSLKHRQFKLFIDEVKSQYSDLLLHNNVRWLSKSFVLQRFFATLKEIKLFLSSSDQLCAKDYLDFLEKNNMSDLSRF